MSREFVWMTTDVAHALFDDAITLGAGVAVASDYKHSRTALRLRASLERERWSAGIGFSYAPPQARGGWLDVEPHASVRGTIGSVDFEGEARVVLRHIDVAGDSIHTLPVEELRLQAELSCDIASRWQLSLLFARAFYDRDLAAERFLGADLGPAIAFAGKPEREALQLLVARKLTPRLTVEAGAIVVGYADRRGGAVIPRIAIRTGPFFGLTVEPLVEVVVGVGAAAAERHLVVGLALGYAR